MSNDFEATIGSRLRAYKLSAAVIAAVEVGVFDAIATGSITTEAIAAATKSHIVSTDSLLAVLAALELVESCSGEWRLKPQAARYLVRDAPEYCGDIVLYHAYAAPSWFHLKEALTGLPPRSRYEALQYMPGFIDSFIGALRRIETAALVHVRALLNPVPAAGFLVDLGCGSATLALDVLAGNPGWTGLLIDRLPLASRVDDFAATLGVRSRCEFLQQNLFDAADVVSQPADLVILSHVLHEYPDARAVDALRLARQLLGPRGKVIVLDFSVRDDAPRNVSLELFQLSVLTLCGRPVPVRTDADYRTLLRSARLEPRSLVRVDGAFSYPQAIILCEPED